MVLLIVKTEIVYLAKFNRLFQDPVVLGLPGTFQSIVDEDTVPRQQLDTFTVTDSDDTITCKVDPASPEAAIFEVVAGTPPGMLTVVREKVVQQRSS